MLHCHVSITLSKPFNSINIKQDNVCEASIELFENATYTAWKKKKKVTEMLLVEHKNMYENV